MDNMKIIHKVLASTCHRIDHRKRFETVGHYRHRPAFLVRNGEDYLHDSMVSCAGVHDWLINSFCEAKPRGLSHNMGMSYRRVPFVVGEFYHCYTRGIDKRVTFNDIGDHERFLQALYVCNDVREFKRDALSNFFHDAILRLERDVPLVSIVAYCLMPNHYHLILYEISENGISRFMQKLGTLYTMYFNAKNERIGSLFVSPFRSKHIDSDEYLKQVIQYVHLNSAELYEPGWKDGIVRDMPLLKKELATYRFSSFPEYAGVRRPEHSILDWGLVNDVYEKIPRLDAVVGEAAEYYRGLRW